MLEEGDKDKIRKKTNEYLKYSGLGFQMLGMLLFFLFVGQKLDSYFELNQPFITIVLILVGFTAYMYKLYVELMK